MRKSETSRKVAGASDVDGNVYTRVSLSFSFSTVLNIIYLNKLKSPSRARHFVAPSAVVAASHPFRERPVASRRLSNPRRLSFSLPLPLSLSLPLSLLLSRKLARSLALAHSLVLLDLRNRPNRTRFNPIVPRLARFAPLRILYKPEDATRCRPNFILYLCLLAAENAASSAGFFAFQIDPEVNGLWR